MSARRRDYFGTLVAHEAALWDAVDRRLAAAGTLRAARLSYLRVVGSGQAARVQDIASRLGVTVGAASRLTDRLAADGFVQRVPNPDDRRSSLIVLTESGERGLREAEAVFDRALDDVLGDIDDAELAALTARLVQLREVVERAGR
ncbi:MAG: MarR family transcriptional regulator [Actinomycetaceae bacterium]|nr:MarR family transcriptional regulator [Actinomycetaceae bacterium]